MLLRRIIFSSSPHSWSHRVRFTFLLHKLSKKKLSGSCEHTIAYSIFVSDGKCPYCLGSIHRFYRFNSQHRWFQSIPRIWTSLGAIFVHGISSLLSVISPLVSLLFSLAHCGCFLFLNKQTAGHLWLNMHIKQTDSCFNPIAMKFSASPRNNSILPLPKRGRDSPLLKNN